MSLEYTFVSEPSPACPSCHAATVVETAGGDLLAAWFGGTAEGEPDVAIWLARYDGHWGRPAVVAAEPGVPLWNPVLFRDAADGLWLLFKVGPAIPAWVGAYIRSHDDGRTWSAPEVLPAGLLGPAKNKPLTLSNGDILCGSSVEAWHAWACWAEASSDGGRSWCKHGPITAPSGAGSVRAHDALMLPADFRGVIQPTLWEQAPGRVTMLMRSTRAVGAVCLASSEDGGRTWSEATPTAIPNPNSGLDAVRLADGRVVLACNPSRDARTPLSLLTSADNGETWPWRLDLETGPGEYSYPSLIQAASGRLHVVYTYRRTHIRHVSLDPADLARPVT